MDDVRQLVDAARLPLRPEGPEVCRVAGDAPLERSRRHRRRLSNSRMEAAVWTASSRPAVVVVRSEREASAT
jgi:hypothetical protein